MIRPFVYSLTIFGLTQGAIFAQDLQVEQIPAIDEVFSEDASEIVTTGFRSNDCLTTGTCDSICDSDLCVPSINGCDSIGCDSWLSCDQPLLSALKDQHLGNCWTYSVGGAVRFRYLDESNRLRPPAVAGSSSYNQWRSTPYLELKYGDDFTAFVEGIHATTYNHDLQQLPIDENQFDLLQYYGDVKLYDGGNGEKLRFRVGRQLLKYGSQHLVSPLGWSNTFRNFEGYRLYYTSSDWDIDAFATRPVNGAAGNFYRPKSYDTPDQSRWFSGVYTTYKKAPKGVIDLYWLWLSEDADRTARLDGNRHTFGMRYAGKHVLNDDCCDPWMTWSWDLEGAFQVGKDVLLAGPAQDVTAGFFSSNNGLTFNQVAWTPTISGIFYWGSGDDDPTDGDLHTVSTLFPLGHAYWGILDNFSGQNLIDYATQVSVKPTEKLTCVAAVHWFQKAQSEDAIWNIAGVPFGNVTNTNSRYLGNEVDLVSTYAFSKNLTLQTGYSWFFYGAAVNGHPAAAVANRDDASQFYFFADWKF